MKSLQVQEGGSHYKDMAIQPLEYILGNNLPFIEGAVVKYVSRFRNKNGIQDLKKARHLLDILIEHEEGKASGAVPGETCGQLAIRLTSPPAASSGSAVLDAFTAPVALLEAPGASLVASRPEALCDPGLPPEFSPKVLAMPASKTDANGHPLGYHAEVEEHVLVFFEGAWSWREVRAVSNTMEGRQYNIEQMPGTTSIYMCPHKHIFAIRTKGGFVLVGK